MKYIRYIFFTIFAVAAFCMNGLAQETQIKVVDEVVAQVNEGVITLSRIKRELKSAVDTLVQEGKTPEQAQKLVDERQGELIANLINEELLIQRAKESGLEGDIEASINQRFAEIMKQNNIKTIEALYAEMEKTGVNPQEIKELWRKQAIRERVLYREVSLKVYWAFSGKEIKDYYERNKDKFKRPETITFSKLFLAFAGRDPAAVREKAAALHTQIKAGGDFSKIVKENGDAGFGSQTPGGVEKLTVAELSDSIAGPLKGVKIGEFTAPIEFPNLGMAILRVDEREAAGTEGVFDDDAVRRAMLVEREPAEKKKYMAKLRDESYIKISDTFRPIVSPILFADERKEKGTN